MDLYRKGYGRDVSRSGEGSYVYHSDVSLVIGRILTAILIDRAGWDGRNQNSNVSNRSLGEVKPSSRIGQMEL